LNLVRGLRRSIVEGTFERTRGDLLARWCEESA